MANEITQKESSLENGWTVWSIEGRKKIGKRIHRVGS